MPMLPIFLPGVVGSAPLWLRCSHDVDTSYGRGEWVVLAGEPGVGKFTLVQGVHQRRNPTGRMHTLDAAELTAARWEENVRRELIDDPVDTLLIRHIDALDSAAAQTLATALEDARALHGIKVPWVAATQTSGVETGPLAELLALFPRTVEVPPLRRHVEDLSELVPLLLSKLSHGGHLNCSPAAMHLLMRANWPGNIGQLRRVLKDVAQRRRTGSIRPTDLPAEYHATSRRQLNRFETVERDIIVRSLDDADGNKVKAAQLLGISRATIYRKIHEYGIVTPSH
jgi:transcriptional regulator of acetoin/glycerol metabolism